MFTSVMGTLPRIHCMVGAGEPTASHSRTRLVPNACVTAAGGAWLIFTQSRFSKYFLPPVKVSNNNYLMIKLFTTSIERLSLD